jgi:hypothetical protein
MKAEPSERKIGFDYSGRNNNGESVRKAKTSRNTEQRHPDTRLLLQTHELRQLHHLTVCPSAKDWRVKSNQHNKTVVSMRIQENQR